MLSARSFALFVAGAAALHRTARLETRQYRTCYERRPRRALRLGRVLALALQPRQNFIVEV